MKRLNFTRPSKNSEYSIFSPAIILITCLILHSAVQAESSVGKVYFTFTENVTGTICDDNLCPSNLDTLPEEKVDYLEQIYFSGENKEGLNTKILIALQELQDQTPTPSLARQVTFLIDIKEKAIAADNACDILDLLAVGIYNIDAAEAMRQGVRPPSEKAKAKSVDAIQSLNKLSSASNNLSGSANGLAWSSYLLSGGKYGSFASGAGKLAGTAATIGTAAGAAGRLGETAKQLGDVGKSLGLGFKKKDKSCNDVAKKDIPIGEHAVSPLAGMVKVQQPGTTVTVKNINYGQLSSLTSAIEKITGVTSVNNENFANNTATILVISNLKTKDLVDNLVQSIQKLNVDGLTATTAVLTLK